MNPVDSASRWHAWSIKGNGGGLAQVIDALAVTLLPGWVPLSGESLQPFRQFVRAGSTWYSLVPTATCAAVTLSIERVLDTELRGGRVWFAAGPDRPPAAASPTGIANAWDQVMRFLDEGILPAARSVPEVRIVVPTLEDLFLGDLPTDVADHLRKFSQTARKVLPLNQGEVDLWQNFVIGASRSKAILDERCFIDWLVRESWKKEDALELSRRFFEQCLLLSRYAEEVAVA